MDYLNSMLSEAKFASCLEDLLTFRRLLAYKLKVSCIKANKLFPAYVLFFRFDEQENSDVCAFEPVLSGVHGETWGYGNLLMPPCLSDPKGVSWRFSRDVLSAAFDGAIAPYIY